MIGAIIGDIVGSVYERHNRKTKDFELFNSYKHFTDDTVLSLAVAQAILNSHKDLSVLGKKTVEALQAFGRNYPNAGYGTRFKLWLLEEHPEAYNSFGNGSAMRVSACGYAADSLEETIALSKAVTEVTHNHPEGIKGAEAIAVAVYLARTGSSMEEIREYITTNYYPIDFTLDEIRPDYDFHVSCQRSVPQALEAFFESTDFEDAIRNAVSIGGDSDTLAAMAGSMAEAYYGVPEDLREKACTYLPGPLLKVLNQFENIYPGK